MSKKRYFLKIVIGALFIATSVGKFFLVSGVAREIKDYQLIPDSLALPAAIALIAYELTVGIWLLTSKKTSWAAYAGIGLLTVFMLAKASMAIRGLPVSCDVCFGTFLSLPLWANLILNTSMIIALLIVLKGLPEKKLAISLQTP